MAYNDKPAHLTVKWPAEGSRPEIMLNLRADDPIQLTDMLANCAPALALAGVALTDPQQDPQEEDAPQPNPIRTPEPAEDGDDPPRQPKQQTCPNRHCSNHRGEMLDSQWGGLYCPGYDQTEAGGRCRWVLDDRGLRRKPTRAEVQAARRKLAVAK